jgi:hypothetical protein
MTKDSSGTISKWMALVDVLIVKSFSSRLYKETAVPDTGM